MYERPETADAHDRYWSLVRDAIRDAGGQAPERLTRDSDPWAVWQDPGLILAQTCGLPFRARLHRQVTLVGTPDYALPGLKPGYYQSVIILRASDPRQDMADLKDATLAYNEGLSQSGWAAPYATGLDHGIYWTRVLRTGAHRDSARAVAGGRADVAALDAVTWRNLVRFEPLLTERLRVLARTEPTPGLPYITASACDAPMIAAAIAAAMAALLPDDRELLGLNGLVRIPPSAYLALPMPPEPGS
jgi:ABC-type phosphate/phosphonate transport system substrate-binding protein